MASRVSTITQQVLSRTNMVKVIEEFGLYQDIIQETGYEQAILLMRQYRQGRPIPRTDVHRFATLYREMKRHHWWLTNTGDYAACAILTYQKPDPGKIMSRIRPRTNRAPANRVSANAHAPYHNGQPG